MLAALSAWPAHAVTLSDGQTFFAGCNVNYTDLQMSGGTLVGPNSGECVTTFQGAITLQGGVVSSGPLTIAGAGSTAQLTGGFTVQSIYQNFPTVSNRGTWVQKANGSLQLSRGGVFVNTAGATYRIENNGGIAADSLTEPDAQPRLFSNAGTLTKNGVYGTSDVSVRVQNTGIVEAATGILRLSGGGTHDGARFLAGGSAGGAIVLNGAHSFDGAISLANVTANSLTAQMTVNKLTVNAGAVVDLSGMLNVSGSLDNAGGIVATKPSGALVVLDDSTLTNNGSIRGVLHNGDAYGTANNRWIINNSQIVYEGWSNHGSLIDNRGSVRIAGVLASSAASTVQNSGVWQVDGDYFSGGSFDNQGGGSVLVSRGWRVLDENQPDSGASIVNAGAITVGVNASLAARSLVQTAGTLTVDGQLSTVGGVVSLLGGTLNGTGLINGDLFVGGGPETARFTPGHSPGSFTIEGNFTLLEGGVLELEVERASNGVFRSDYLYASHMQLDGTLHMSFTDAAADGSWVSYWLDCHGNCAYGPNFQVTFDDPNGGFVYYDQDGISISLAPAPQVPEPATWLLLLAGGALLTVRHPARSRTTLRGRPSACPDRCGASV